MKTLLYKNSIAAVGLILSLGASVQAQSKYEPYTFATFAGNTGYGSADGTGSAARFNVPFGVAVDSVGNVYVADSTNHTIRKITAGGVVSTLAGLAGTTGSDDGTGSAARFRFPNGVAVDGSGNLYVADSGNHIIRKITAGGVVSTLAGLAGSNGSADGAGSAARFNSPLGIAVDSGGNLYVADTVNSTIRMITPAGVVTTLAGLAGNSGTADGTGSAARFGFPRGLAVDGAGTVYVGDSATIRSITPGGVVSTLAGSALESGSADGTGSAARFDFPFGITVDGGGNLYVADTGNNTIRKITPGAVVSTLAGVAGTTGSADGTGSAARFNFPAGMAVDGGGNVYVADSKNNTIRKLTAGGVVSTLAGAAGGPGSADGTGSAARFNLPNGVAVDGAKNVYVADSTNSTIRKITPARVVSTVAGLAGSPGSADATGSAARFNLPNGIAVDGAGNLYVADTSNHTIRKISAGGVVSTLAGVAGSTGSADGTGSAARFNLPNGVAVDGAKNVYVADTNNHTIRKITAGGVVSTLAGSAGKMGSADGTGSAARFNLPAGVAVDGGGNLYVADSGNHTIRKVTAGGVVSTLAGMAGTEGSADGTGPDAGFTSPNAVAVDGTGNVYVADTGNGTIRKITAGGAVTTLAGVAGTTDNADGTGSAARFASPMGVAVDAAGNVYVADTANSTIRVGNAATVAVNISTRMGVGTGENVLIAGFIVTGSAPKKVILRGIGPSLGNAGTPLPGRLMNPVLELHGGDGSLMASNDDWRSTQQQAIIDSKIPPSDDRESAIVATLQPGNYSAILSGKDNTTGIGLVELYDLDTAAAAELAEISTRGSVETGDNVMIGGFILSRGAGTNVLVRAIGPSLTVGVSGALQDPTLELRDGNGALLQSNDDWQSDQKQAIIDTGVPPTDTRESAILRHLLPGNYTAVVSGKAGHTGVALVEIYVLQ